MSKSDWDGDRLRAARKRSRQTQVELGAVLSVSENTISRWELGGRAPRGRNRRAVEAWITSALRRSPVVVGLPESVMKIRDNLVGGLESVALLIRSDGSPLPGEVIEEIRACLADVELALLSVASA